MKTVHSFCKQDLVRSNHSIRQKWKKTVLHNHNDYTIYEQYQKIVPVGSRYH